MCVILLDRSRSISLATASPATNTFPQMCVQCFSKKTNFSRRIVNSDACVSLDPLLSAERSIADGLTCSPCDVLAPVVSLVTPAANSPRGIFNPKPGGLRLASEFCVSNCWGVGDGMAFAVSFSAAPPKAPRPFRPSDGNPTGRVVTAGRLSAKAASSSLTSRSDPDDEHTSDVSSLDGTVLLIPRTFSFDPDASPARHVTASVGFRRDTPPRFKPRPTIDG
mmetsp:Transcript_5046/g.16809  ORF Transcript_5046/g.16809 Transcript_5046/m.16809 type:complete len:222 (-) Transcript_5046:71-736(-)